MPSERGGRADKTGNRYEIRTIMYELLKVVREEYYSVEIEPLGEDELGTDILITRKDGVKEHQQCKVRNASKKAWTIAELNSHGILPKWRSHLERDNSRGVALISTINCDYIVDLHNRAMTAANPESFYYNQILGSDKTFVSAYKDFSKYMGLAIIDQVSGEKNLYEIQKSIDYLQRVNFKQLSEHCLDEYIDNHISLLFVTDKDTVKDALLNLIINGAIWGKELTNVFLIDYFQKHNIVQRSFAGDLRHLPRINRLNQEYQTGFKLIGNELIERTEFAQCYDMIDNEQSFIISGGAGSGKSGCTAAIIKYCENKRVPHLAIKLDRRVPSGSSTFWGKELGFQDSVSFVLNSVAQNMPAVLILDQLDALRWTQTRSKDAIYVCMEIIEEIENLNLTRDNKIIIILVCREFDLKNDNNIQELRDKYENWEHIVVKKLDEEVVKNTVGHQYASLSSKTKELLQTPSNLYIWQHLSEKNDGNDCKTASHLIEKWYRQICKKYSNMGNQESSIELAMNNTVSRLDSLGRLFAPQRIIDIEESVLEYLISEDLLVSDGNKIGFIHQSILDYFLARKMEKQFYADETIERIVGVKSKQTPGRRYQVQMLLQNLLENNSGDFIKAGNAIIESSNVRYYIKYVFYEILREIDKPDYCIENYVLKACKDVSKREPMLENVVYGHYIYVAALVNNGIMEQWFSDEKMKSTVFWLLRSVGEELKENEVDFILKRAFISKDDDEAFMKCFLFAVDKETDEMFELRLQFYHHYPERVEGFYLNISEIIKVNEARAIRLLKLMLQDNIHSKGKDIYRSEEQMLSVGDSFLIKNGQFVLDELIPYVPTNIETNKIHQPEWVGKIYYCRGLERAAVELIKNANKSIIKDSPDYFWDFYKPYFGKGYSVFNEIILHGMGLLPAAYSDRVIEYISEDFEKRIIDETSNNDDELELVKRIIVAHARTCENTVLNRFVENLVRFFPSDCIERYSRRIKYNKEQRHEKYYGSFWGELQFELLKVIPEELLQAPHRDLLRVFERKFGSSTNRYIEDNSGARSVQSPVTNKSLSTAQWLQIITNDKIDARDHFPWKEENGHYIESSIEMYRADFRKAVSDNPKEYIEIVIANKNKIHPAYIHSLYSGVAYSENIQEVSQELWEKLFDTLFYDKDCNFVISYCEIIEKSGISSWSSKVFERLIKIALDEDIDTYVKRKESEKADSEQLISISLNSTRGHAIAAIARLLWDNKELFSVFMESIDALAIDKSAPIRMATLRALWPVYNIDREWASLRLLSVYESDIRMLGFNHTKDMMFQLYKSYPQRVLQIVRESIKSQDNRLQEMGGHTICEFNIIHNEFEDILNDIAQYDETFMQAILRMAVIYLKGDEYREKSKDIILRCRDTFCDVEFSLVGMFDDKLIDVRRDKEFLLKLMNSKVSRRMVYSFADYLQKTPEPVINFADIIITLCENVLDMPREELAKCWGMDRDISKLVMTLYDETVGADDDEAMRINEKCLELWDVMFEKQIGLVRELSRQLMEK